MCGLGGPGGAGVPGSAASAAGPGSGGVPGPEAGYGGSAGIPGMGTSGIGAPGVGAPGGPGVAGPGGGGWGSSDVVNWGNLALSALTMAFPALAPLTAATATATIPFSFEDMNISRPVPAMTAEETMNQSGGVGQPTALPSVSTPTAAPAPVEAAPPAVDNTAYNKTLMDQYISYILNMPSGGGRGIRGVGLPGYKQQQKQTADEWLSKYWRE